MESTMSSLNSHAESWWEAVRKPFEKKDALLSIMLNMPHIKNA